MAPARRYREPVVVAVEGSSGSGKTTAATALATLLSARLVREAYDRLGRSVPLEVRTRAELAELEARLLDEEGRRWSELRSARARGESVVLDTGTLGPLAYSWGLREGLEPSWDVVGDLARRARRSRARDAWGLADITLYLDVPEGVALARARGAPATHDPALVERHQVVGRFERLLYARELPRRFPGRFGSVEGEGDPREVALTLQERLERFAPLPPWSEAETERLLALFDGAGPAATGAPRARDGDPNP